MIWMIDDLEKKIKHRLTLRKCKRCLLLYKKSLENCSHCTDINDTELALLMRERARFRISLGNKMLYGAVIIVLLMFIFFN